MIESKYTQIAIAKNKEGRRMQLNALFIFSLSMAMHTGVFATEANVLTFTEI